MIFLEKEILKIRNKKGVIEKFRLNKSQKKIHYAYKKQKKTQGKSRLCIVKPRQIGGTSWSGRLQLSSGLSFPYFESYTIAHTLDSASKIFKNHMSLTFDLLPESFKNLYKIDRNSANELRFDQALINGRFQNWASSLRVGTSARSSTLSFLHVSELGKIAMSIDKYKEVVNGSFDAAESGDIIVESTGEGLNAFYDFVNLKLEDPMWEVIFPAWYEQEEYKLQIPESEKRDWQKEYGILANNYGLCHDPVSEYGLTIQQFYWYFLKAKEKGEEVKASYPFSLEEAFVSSNESFFNNSYVKEEIEKAKLKPYRRINEFYIWEEPKANCMYVVSVDCATGEGNDNTSINVFNANTLEQVAEATGKFDEPLTASLAIWAALKYNSALVGVEVNNMGRAVNRIVMDSYFRDKIYERETADNSTLNPRAKVKKAGWLTTEKTRPNLLVDFRAVFQESRELKINSVEALKEFLYFSNVNGKYKAQNGKKDDRTLSCMIAYQLIKYLYEKYG